MERVRKNARQRTPFLVACAVAVSALTPAARAETVRPEVIRSFPHDRTAFTQGLLLHERKLYESTGLLGRSSLRRVTLATGKVESRVTLAGQHFGEGLALADQRLVQLTWQNGVALVYDLALHPLGSFEYQGEGWGLCHDGKRFVMSDGSSRLSFRASSTFALIGQVEVRRAGNPVTRLNELECVGSLVYANVWQTNSIVRIDAASGNVLTTIDATNLLTPEEARGTDVLNGIAHDAATGHFFITGKLWPKLFEVRFDVARSVDAGTNGSAPRAPSATTASAPEALRKVAGAGPRPSAPAKPAVETSRDSGCALAKRSERSALSLVLCAVLTAFRLGRRRPRSLSPASAVPDR